MINSQYTLLNEHTQTFSLLGAIASSSSMKIIAGAFFSASSKAFLRLLSDSPANLLIISGPLMRKKNAPVSLATARAISVLPVPGGPYRRIPRGGWNTMIYELRGAFKKFCNLTITKYRNVTNYTLVFNTTPTEFNEFATFFRKTVNSTTKIEIFCLSLQPFIDSFLQRFIVRIAYRRSESSVTWH